MARILFWNVKNGPASAVAAVALSTQSDIVALLENPSGSDETLEALRGAVSSDYFAPLSIGAGRFHCFCKNTAYNLEEIYNSSRISVRRLRLGSQRLLIAFVHSVDTRNNDMENRQSFVQELATEMRFVKQTQGNNRLIIMGDFNMNPFDRGMNLAAGLNAMMTRECVSGGVRQCHGKKYEYYYNPMWGLFGDNTPGPPGTIYDRGNQGPFGWSMYDQVLLNHSIVNLFESIEIISKAKGVKLATKRGRPAKQLSDHFPILLTIRENIQ